MNKMNDSTKKPSSTGRNQPLQRKRVFQEETERKKELNKKRKRERKEKEKEKEKRRKEEETERKELVLKSK